MRFHSFLVLSAVCAGTSAFDARAKGRNAQSIGQQFAHDVQVALRALAAKPSPAPSKKRSLVNGARCVAEPSTVQFPMSGTNGSSSPSSPSSPAAASPTSPGGSSSPWTIAQHYSGSSFFSGWNFYTNPDPTQGTVNYVDQATALSSGLASINSAGNAVMRVDTTPIVTGNRNSVRITTSYTYTGGLVILDAVHMPTGCATWPAFWSDGPNWPTNGEIDIVEGVNQNANNQATIHTRAGCTVPQTEALAGATGTLVGGSDCTSGSGSNAGCGSQLSSPGNNYGAGFNSNGGGVYAMEWVTDAISVWFFPRQSIPSDITAQTPQPSGWGAPFARWPGASCDTMSFFRNHSSIFDTTLCGEWAGNVWATSGAVGQDQSCAVETGIASCSAFVQQQGASFSEAYWEVKSVTIYQ